MPQAAGCRAHIAASGAIRARATSARWACRRARDTPVPCDIPGRSHIAAVQPAKFNPLPIDVGIGDDWIFFAEVLGLKDVELRRTIEIGGPKFAATFTSGTANLTIDANRPSLLAEHA